MNKFTTSVLCLLFSTLACAQGSGTFVKTYLPDTGSSYFSTLLPLPDGGFLMAGTCSDSVAGFSDALVVRTDASGETIWSTRYGKQGFNEEILSAQLHPDGGFVLCGFLERIVGPFQNLRSDMLLVRMDDNGEILWTKSVGDDDDDERADAIKVNSDGYFLMGRTFSNPAGYMAPCVFRLDNSGNYISHNLVEDQDDDDYLLSWASTNDGGFIACGSTRSYGVGNGHIYLIRYTADGDVVWTKTHSTPGLKSLAASILPAGPGAFLIAGYGEIETAPLVRSFDFMAMKISENGDSLWTRCYGNGDEERANSIAPTADGGFVLAGTSNSNSLGGSDAFLIRINANGDTLWTRRYGTSGNDGANAISVVQDGSIVWAGKWSENAAVLTKCSSEGISCFSQNAAVAISPTQFVFEDFNNPVLQLENPHARFDTLNLAGAIDFEELCPVSITEYAVESSEPLVFPNPARNEFQIRSSEPIKFLSMTDAAGRTLFFSKESATAISISENTPGVYFVKIQTSKGTYTRKLIIQN